MNRAVFLDRDGTINVDKGYVFRTSDFELLPGVREALTALRAAGYLLVVITNQSGIARGYYSEADAAALNAFLCRALLSEGVLISGVYVCPHHPDAALPRYRRICDCRKPEPGLFLRAAGDLDIDLDASFAVGDRMRDLCVCGVSGARGYLLGAADNPGRLPGNIKPVPDLAAAARDILSGG